jgi:hypothetical protein
MLYLLMLLVLILIAVSYTAYSNLKKNVAARKKIRKHVGLTGLIAAVFLILKFFPNVFISFITFFPVVWQHLVKENKKKIFL